MSIEQLDFALLVGAVVTLVAVAAVRISANSGLPTLLVYLAVGMGLGSDGLGLEFSDAQLTTLLGYCALVLILIEGGITTRWSRIRSVVAPAAVLATFGSVISIVVAGVAAVVLLHLDLVSALLLAAVVSVTDAAAVFSVLRRLPLPTRLVGLLEAESGFNDAPVVIAVIALTSIATGGGGAAWPWLVAAAALELLLGTCVGLVVGALGAWALPRSALPSAGLYPIAVVALGVAAFGAASLLHGSGFLAAYLASLTLGNARMPHRAAVRGFAEGLGWIAQIGLFVLLGLLVDPHRLTSAVGPALVMGAVLLLIARPISVFTSVSWFGFRWYEQLILSWAGLRGAVPIVLATVPMAAGVPGSSRLFDVVFVLVVIFTLIQAPTLPWIVKALRMERTMPEQELEVDSSPLGALGAELIQMEVPADSRLHGVEIFELRLPQGANITLITRQGRTLVPEPHTTIRHGDHLILVTPAQVRDETERRLRVVNAGGRLATWHHPEQARPPRSYPWQSRRRSARRAERRADPRRRTGQPWPGAQPTSRKPPEQDI